jgi:hypothetical protein
VGWVAQSEGTGDLEGTATNTFCITFPYRELRHPHVTARLESMRRGINCGSTVPIAPLTIKAGEALLNIGGRVVLWH